MGLAGGKQRTMARAPSVTAAAMILHFISRLLGLGLGLGLG